ncbi:putative choline kinase [Spiroplasma sabaudiense Ar-1343]|uniref:Putative choline kinase n=1 Tax=Spiroplasma sabaudiense Ar-1343 TaxID=1276257 RepID=W6AAS9_9MOLU|nr:phosphotransferase [Spiroplasma sabaudiense]AHI53960.1 putative choline kinase [Spiroplasma sabaudiense Ar-1343]
MKKIVFLELGLTNSTYLENNLFVKKSNFIVDNFLDRKNEYQVLKEIKANPQNFLLTPVEFGIKNGLFVSKFDYFQEAQTFEQLPINDEAISKVVDALQKLHQLPADNPKIKTFNFKKMMSFFEKNTHEVIYDVTEFRPTIDIFLETNLIEKCVLTHNDLVPGNFLFIDEELKIIDYDYMCYNDPLFDLASFISETLKQNPIWTRQFLKPFNLSVIDFKKLTNYIFYQNYLWLYWSMYMLERTKNEVFRKIADEKYQQLKNTKIT